MRSTLIASLGQSSNSGVPDPVADSLPNAAFVNDPAVVSDKRLDSPAFAITSAAAQLTFRNNYALEASPPSFFDGGVLEISIGGGAFTDIIAAGGSFVTGGYTGTISTSFSNPYRWSPGVERELRWLYHHHGEPAGGRCRTEYRLALAHGQRHRSLGVRWLEDRQRRRFPARGLSGSLLPRHCYAHANSNGYSNSTHPHSYGHSRAADADGYGHVHAYAYSYSHSSRRPRHRRHLYPVLHVHLLHRRYNRSGTTDIGNHGDDVGTVISLPFPVTLYGTRYTQATAGSNGHLTFGTAYNGFSITCSPFGNTAATDATGPYWGDQCTGHATLRLAPAAGSSPPRQGPLPTGSSTWSIERTTTV